MAGNRYASLVETHQQVSEHLQGQSTPQPESSRPEGHHQESPGWTDMGDMASQQASALEWAKAAQEYRQEQFEAGKELYQADRTQQPEQDKQPERDGTSEQKGEITDSRLQRALVLAEAAREQERQEKMTQLEQGSMEH